MKKNRSDRRGKHTEAFPDDLLIEEHGALCGKNAKGAERV
jgi:hypothetical protein